ALRARSVWAPDYSLSWNGESAHDRAARKRQNSNRRAKAHARWFSVAASRAAVHSQEMRCNSVAWYGCVRMRAVVALPALFALAACKGDRQPPLTAGPGVSIVEEMTKRIVAVDRTKVPIGDAW